MKSIVLGGGCFWGVEAYFKQLKGVLNTSVGYVNGNKKNPTYREVCDGIATHTEACQIFYDERFIQIEQILDHFFRIIDPFAKNRQGHDIGRQYRSGIYFDDKNDEKVIISFIKNRFGKDYDRVQTEVKENIDYDQAEGYHQDYLKKNPGGYCHVDLNLAKKEEIK